MLQADHQSLLTTLATVWPNSCRKASRPRPAQIFKKATACVAAIHNQQREPA